MSIDEVRIVGRIINENQHLKNEIEILDSMIVVKDKHVFLLQENVTACRSIMEQQISVISSFEEIDRLRVQQINDIHKFHKKDKRKTALRFGGGGVALGILLMLIFN